MGFAFSYDNDFRLQLVEKIETKELKNIDEITDMLKECLADISDQIYDLENADEFSDETEKKLAVLIRKQQYINLLINMDKTDLAKFFQFENDNCIFPDILQWYQGPERD